MEDEIGEPESEENVKSCQEVRSQTKKKIFCLLKKLLSKKLLKKKVLITGVFREDFINL